MLSTWIGLLFKIVLRHIQRKGEILIIYFDIFLNL